MKFHKKFIWKFMHFGTKTSYIFFIKKVLKGTKHHKVWLTVKTKNYFKSSISISKFLKPKNSLILAIHLNLSKRIGQHFQVGIELLEQAKYLLLVLEELDRLRVRVVAHREWPFDLRRVLSGLGGNSKEKINKFQFEMKLKI